MKKVIVDRHSLSAYHFKWEPDEGKTYFVDFAIYDISWVSYNGTTGERDYPSYYDLEDYNNMVDHEPNEATLPKISGHIKWDGCCNYEIHELPMLHRCGLNGFENDFEQIKKAYEVSAEFMGDTADLDMMGLIKNK